MHQTAASDEWANGSRGYLKKGFVIAQMQAAGFEFVASSDVNANSKDQPAAEDIVWRLPPSLRGAKDRRRTHSKNARYRRIQSHDIEV